jgi:hypothetical protein
METRYFRKILYRFKTLFGEQKTRSVFNSDDESWDEISNAWESYLRSVDPEVIRKALESLANNPPDWPPALGEFIKLCKQMNRPEHRVALAPPRFEPTEEGLKLQAEIISSIAKSNFDYLGWAKRPGSARAVALLLSGAKDDRRLRDILNHLIATDGQDCKRDDARSAIRKLSSSVRGEVVAA